MATYGVPEEKLTAIADAIRLKTDTASPMSLDEMALQIGMIGGQSNDMRVEKLFTLADYTSYGQLMNYPPIKLRWKKSYALVFTIGTVSTGLSYRWVGFGLLQTDGIIENIRYTQWYSTVNLSMTTDGFIAQNGAANMGNNLVISSDGILDFSRYGVASSTKFAAGDTLYMVEIRLGNSEEW